MAHRRLQFQHLEPRYALAGNVTATVADGDLFLTGDVDANRLRINQSSNGDLEITGQSGTTINGLSVFPVVVAGLTGDVHVQMLAGDDEVRFQMGDGLLQNVPGVLPGSLNVNLGSGNDTLLVLGPDNQNGPTPVPFQIAGSIVVYGRDGNDRIEVERVEAGGDVLIYGNEGDDEVQISTSGLGVGFVVGQVLVDMGGGDDEIFMHGYEIERLLIRDNIGVTTGSDILLHALNVTTTAELFLSIHDDDLELGGVGGHSFTAADLIVHTGNGNDQLEFYDVVVNNLSVYTGEGNEGGGVGYGVTLTDLNIANQLWLETGGGLDNVLIDSCAIGHMRVYSGTESDGVIVLNTTTTDAVFDTYDGGDVLGIHGSTFANFLIALLGSGDDWLVVSNDDVDGPATFDGGLGADQFSDFGGNAFARLIRTSI